MLVDEPAAEEQLCKHTGAHSLAGTKETDPNWQCQDAHLVYPLSDTCLMVAVFDGHGHGGRMAAHIARRIFAGTPAERLLGSGAEEAPAALQAKAGELLSELFVKAHKALAREVDSDGQLLAQFAGTTATVAILDLQAGMMTTAHVGDSRLVLVGSDGHVEAQTADHIVDDEAEERVLKSGGEVRVAEISGITARRVYMKGSPYPGIMMSRSLGDVVAHSIGLSHEPEVRTSVALSPGGVLIVASDGVWEHLTSEEVAKHITGGLGEGVKPTQLARHLVETARARWPAGHSDDITAVVVVVPPASAEEGRGEEQVEKPDAANAAERLEGAITSPNGAFAMTSPKATAEKATNLVASPSSSSAASSPARLLVLSGASRLEGCSTSTNGIMYTRGTLWTPAAAARAALRDDVAAAETACEAGTPALASKTWSPVLVASGSFRLPRSSTSTAGMPYFSRPRGL
mmetsp:Transcript_33745/g.85506  ORF Transcript_33745/g.85506 Transcript_33745/m.85506 type:complete len:460 (+) Transcript_33745:1099-2478(+)